VLLSSEVGCEGLDYQFCNGIVNYDLPWNPMRVEQRIGRIDRYGQESQVVLIYNFITPGTVDAEIYERCLLRIGVFRQSLGGSEEILGRLTKEIRKVAENLELTASEQAARLQQLTDNEIRAIQEQAKLEEEQTKLFGISLPVRDNDMVKDATCFWLKPLMVANLVKCYLEKLGIVDQRNRITSSAIATIKFDQESRNKLLADFRAIKQSGTVSRQWESWLRGASASLQLTFDPSTADQRRDVAFINPVHPLARQAAQYFDPTGPLMCNVRVESAEIKAGRYPYAIYCWRKLGLKEDFSFQPICNEEGIISRMLLLLESATLCETGMPITSDEELALEQIHHRLWCNARAQHLDELQETVRSRLLSLKTSHAGRLSILEEQRDHAFDERIRRMRDSQIETAISDFERRVDELEKSSRRGDIITEVVVFGVLVVEKENE
jgi:hypothetical protein